MTSHFLITILERNNKTFLTDKRKPSSSSSFCQNNNNQNEKKKKKKNRRRRRRRRISKHIKIKQTYKQTNKLNVCTLHRLTLTKTLTHSQSVGSSTYVSTYVHYIRANDTFERKMKKKKKL